MEGRTAAVLMILSVSVITAAACMLILHPADGEDLELDRTYRVCTNWHVFNFVLCLPRDHLDAFVDHQIICTDETF